MDLNELRELLLLLRANRVTHYRSGGLELKLDLKDSGSTAAPVDHPSEVKTFRGVNPNYSHPSLGLAGRIKLNADD